MALGGPSLRFGSERGAEQLHTRFPKVHKYANAFHEAHKISQFTSLCVRSAQLSLMFNSSESRSVCDVDQIIRFSQQSEYTFIEIFYEKSRQRVFVYEAACMFLVRN
ncbi:hypothetical protein TNIN_84261 [Trichonephila inaurata madagascariensis]|uniref:Uncharacterized protein n=1 Tax=Trichonephila inaurata madagascariensis TaxID=2747483 RepID=A0A8X6XEE0_9ARAC|nr:hypothetical protein TNIN_84261 [Trichonephila inaurata madagascariensis]